MSRPDHRPADLTDHEILKALAQAPEPVASTTEVARIASAAYRPTLHRLKALLREASVEARKLPDGWVWRLTEQGRTDLNALELSHQTRRNSPWGVRAPRRPEEPIRSTDSNQPARRAE